MKLIFILFFLTSCFQGNLMQCRQSCTVGVKSFDGETCVCFSHEEACKK